MVADKGKKAKLETEEETEVVDEALVVSIEKLQEVQDDLERINEEAHDKVLEVEQKYSVVRRPIYEKRSEVMKTIPDFWLTAFLSHPALCDILTEQDQKIFKHLESLDVADCMDLKSGYSIIFNFNENPFFENLVLTKTFTFSDEGTTSMTATPIKWKTGMGPSVNGVTDEKNGKKRPFEEQSFFSWFSEIEQKDFGDLQDEVGEIIKEDLWPNPLKYFNNEEVDEDDSGEEDDEENGADDDEDNEEEDEEEEGEENDDDEAA